MSSWEQGTVDDYIEIMKKDRQWRSHIELNAFSKMTHMDIYVYLDFNDPTNVIMIDHPKNNGKLHILFSNNYHYDALVPYNGEEEKEKDQQDTNQEYISANFSTKEVNLKASKKIRRKTNIECNIEKTKQLFSTNSNKNNRFPFFKYADRGEARYFEEVFQFFKSKLTKFPFNVYDQK